jgi:hypothetical protein
MKKKKKKGAARTMKNPNSKRKRYNWERGKEVFIKSGEWKLGFCVCGVTDF